MAAGFSSRAGAFKMELPLQGKSLICRTIEGMYDFCSRIFLVGGHKIERLVELTREYAKVRVVFNEHYPSGMFSSVQEGVKHIEKEKFFFIPGDCPLVKKEVYRKLLHAPGDIVIPLFRGRKGHPVLMKSFLAEEILREPQDSNLRDFIRGKGYETVEVEDETILIDVDTKADYKKAIEKSRFL